MCNSMHYNTSVSLIISVPGALVFNWSSHCSSQGSVRVMQASQFHKIWHNFCTVAPYIPDVFAANACTLWRFLSSIKLKIAWQVGAGLLEMEFDWCSQIPYEDMSVIVSTDRLLKKSTTIALQIDLSVQFIWVPFCKGGQHKMWGTMHSYWTSLFLASSFFTCWIFI